MDSGAIGDCGRMPRRWATSRVDRSWMSWPSRRTEPDATGSSRATDLSRVDFPQAFGPTSAVILPGSIPRDSSSMIGFRS